MYSCGLRNETILNSKKIKVKLFVLVNLCFSIHYQFKFAKHTGEMHEACYSFGVSGTFYSNFNMKVQMK